MSTRQRPAAAAGASSSTPCHPVHAGGRVGPTGSLLGRPRPADQKAARAGGEQLRQQDGAPCGPASYIPSQTDLPCAAANQSVGLRSPPLQRAAPGRRPHAQATAEAPDPGRARRCWSLGCQVGRQRSRLWRCSRPTATSARSYRRGTLRRVRVCTLAPALIGAPRGCCALLPLPLSFLRAPLAAGVGAPATAASDQPHPCRHRTHRGPLAARGPRSSSWELPARPPVRPRRCTRRASGPAARGSWCAKARRVSGQSAVLIGCLVMGFTCKPCAGQINTPRAPSAILPNCMCCVAHTPGSQLAAADGQSCSRARQVGGRRRGGRRKPASGSVLPWGGDGSALRSAAARGVCDPAPKSHATLTPHPTCSTLAPTPRSCIRGTWPPFAAPDAVCGRAIPRRGR